MGDDPFELLSRGRPQERPLVRGDRPDVDILIDRIVAGDVSSAAGGVARRRGRRWAAAVTVGALVAAGGAVAAWWAAEPSDTSTVACWSDPSPDPAVVIALLADTAVTPVHQCEQLWASGTFGDGDVPALQACVTDAGIVAVMPAGSRSCSDLGLVDAVLPAAGRVDEGAQVANMISDQYPRGCITAPDDAAAVIDDLLDRAGVSGWTVRVAGVDDHDGSRPCWFAAVDASVHEVLIVNAAAPPSP